LVKQPCLPLPLNAANDLARTQIVELIRELDLS